jgi:hypothetical protein
MIEKRKQEIQKLLTDNPETVNYLCSLPDDRYEVMFTAMKLVKLLEMQRVSKHDEKCAKDVYRAYVLEKTGKIALMAFLYGKIQGKREERARTIRKVNSDKEARACQIKLN